MTCCRIVFLSLVFLLVTGCATTSESQKARKELDLKTAANANTQLGIEYLREGNYEMSKMKLDKALELDPDYIGAHEAIAVLYGRVGEDKLADKHYRKALRLDPERAQSHNNYGQFLCSQGRYEEAEKEFMSAANNPFYASPGLPLTNAGLCAARAKDEEKAENYFRMALQKDPEFAPALLQMARRSYEQGNYMSGRGYMQRFQQVANHNADSLWLAIRLEYELGDHEAWGNYAVILRNNYPDSEQADRLRRWENEHITSQ